MRIASSQFQATMNRGLEANQAAISKLTEQMSTGDKILVPSDDPVTSVRLSRLTREQAIVTQYRSNISAVKVRLSNSETYLTGMVNDIQQTSDNLVWASDGGNASADLNAMGPPMAALQQSLFYAANEKDQEGHYIFSGTLTNTPAITYDATAPLGSRYTYTGNTGTEQVTVGNGVTQAANVNIQGLDTYLNQLDVAIDQLNQPGVVTGSPPLQAALKTALDGSSTALNLVSGRIADLGGSQNIMTTLDNNHANVSLANETAITDLGQLDYGQAATSMNGYQLALQASYKSYAMVSGLSLFNAL